LCVYVHVSAVYIRIIIDLYEHDFVLFVIIIMTL